MAAAVYRDRTSEFRSLSRTLKKIDRGPAPNQNENAPSTSKQSTPQSYSRSEFNRKASRIGLGIHETSQKIARLAQLAKKSSMFNDPIVEIQESTALIKNDITALNSAVSDLQTSQNMEIADGNYSEDRIVHSTAVCDDLKSKLMETKQLQDVLTARTENIKAHENRKQIFSKNASRENPFQHRPKPATEPPPWSSSTNASENFQQTSATSIPTYGTAGCSMAGVALHNVESTITELSGTFSHLATMVAHQGELAIRIDGNMDESLANVEGAHSSLLRHLNQMSSNRWLLIKIFAILILFLMVFTFFVA